MRVPGHPHPFLARPPGNALSSVRLFDVHCGKGMDSGRKGVALGWILQKGSRTLAGTEADRIVSSTTRQLEHELKATIRE